MLVFKYLLRVFKYLSNAHNNNPVKKYALSLITVQCTYNAYMTAELSADQRRVSKIF